MYDGESVTRVYYDHPGSIPGADYNVIHKMHIANIRPCNIQSERFFFCIFTFAQNIDCGYHLGPPQRGGSNEYPRFVFDQK